MLLVPNAWTAEAGKTMHRAGITCWDHHDGQQLEGKLRFFIGYAGWTPGQLEDEIKSRSWFVTNADVDTIMSTDAEDEAIWKSMITQMGAGFDHIANAPADPSMN